MWLEIKAVFTFISLTFLGIAVALGLLAGGYSWFFILMAVVFILLGDIVLGMKISRNHLQPLLDPLPPNTELCVYFDFSGNIDFLVVNKSKEGVRQFVKYKKDASIINKGDYQIISLNGNHGFIGHEDYIFNVNLHNAKALDQCEGDDIKEIYEKRFHLFKKKVKTSG